MRHAIIPCLRYDDAPEAILFLCDAFGFLPRAVHLDDDDQRIVHHAQLVLGEGMVMLGSTREAGDDAPIDWLAPEDAGGVTATIYVVVADVDSHHAQALAHGADILSAPHDNAGYPGREYTARDPEGHVWSFGSYDPFAPPEDA